MTTCSDKEKETAAKVYKWFQDRMFMEKYGSRLKKSRYTTLMRIFKESGSYTFVKGGTYFIYFKLRDMGLYPSYNTSRCLYILSLISIPSIISAALLYFFLLS
jgi:hypothetical protein